MSHLEAPRIVISGRFISDVSTINNDDVNFDIKQAPDPSDLGWNPRGGATFDFYNCNVSGALGSGGPAAATDPVLSLAVSGAPDRPSGKMVDLDPDWQMSSEIWGLTVRLFDPKTGDLALQGKFGVTQFRDLFMRQLAQAIAGQLPNGQPSGGRFVSVLTGVTWGPVADRSPLIKELRTLTEGDELSIVLNMFGYYYTEADGRHTTGALTGCIGPRHAAEPRTFVGARRLPALSINLPGVQRPVVLLGPADARIDAERATIDLGHALLISDTDGTITDISTIGTALSGMAALEFGLLPNETTQSGARLNDGAATIFGPIDYLKSGWPRQTGGVASIPISAALATQAASKPLALLARMADGSHLVLTRETRDGLYVRADSFVHRLDPGGPGGDTAFFAYSRGLPVDNQTIHLALSPMGNNTPAQAFGFPNTIKTDGSGQASLHVTASDPGTARPDIDGQIYAVGYSPRVNAGGQPDLGGTGLGPLDVVVAHVRSGFPVPDRPEWFRDVQPIMAQFAQLYPIMSRHLFDLADYDAMAKHRRMLLLAFGRLIEDPNYMPVTRDLSENKRQTIIKWLKTETGDPDAPLVKGIPITALVARAAPPVRRRSPMAAQARAFGEDDIKRAMALLFAEKTEAVLPTTNQSGR